MPGVVAIIIVLLVIPVVVLMTGAVASAIVGHFLWKDGEARYEGSELVELND